MKRAKKLVVFFCSLTCVAGVAGGGWYLGTAATAAKGTSHEPQVAITSPSSSPADGGTTNPLLLGGASPSPSSSVVATPTPVTALETIAQPLKVLMYHYIRDGVDKKKDPTGYGLSVTPAGFEHQLELLQSAGYQSVTMSEVATGKISSQSVAITFDDGYEDLYTNALPLLKKYHFSATAYVITGRVGTDGYMDWTQIKDLQKAGVEIGSHTVTHRELNTLSASDQRTELESSRAVLSQELGTAIVSFCYPVGRYDDTTVGLVREAGYTSAVTTKNGSLEAGDSMFTLKRERISPDVTDLSFKKLFPAA